MKLTATLFSTLVISGCAAGPWYQAEHNSHGARLRVVALGPGNTGISSIPERVCNPQQQSYLGWFHPDAGAMQAGRRGFDRKIGMPLGNGYPDNLYAEHLIDSGKPLHVYASGIHLLGPTPYDFGSCETAATFTPQPGRDYEIVFGYTKQSCDLKLFELVRQDSRHLRMPSDFDGGTLSCNK